MLTVFILFFFVSAMRINGPYYLLHLKKKNPHTRTLMRPDSLKHDDKKIYFTKAYNDKMSVRNKILLEYDYLEKHD